MKKKFSPEVYSMLHMHKKEVLKSFKWLKCLLFYRKSSSFTFFAYQTYS